MQCIGYPLTSIAMSFMILFGSLEVTSMIEDGWGYFEDPWNWVDFTSLCLNTLFLGLSSFDYIFESEFFEVELIRSIAAFACFFMWVKVFYWMRLFSSLAYYVKLILQTITDSMPFMLMVGIIILSFSNYFYVIDRNLTSYWDEERDGMSYYKPYTNHKIIDVITSVYMLGALGDFESDVYRLGYDRYAAMGMFIIATFVISVVFMNMLIAIMGETFGSVTEEAEISGLKEQVVMISDFAWLVDMDKVFKN